MGSSVDAATLVGGQIELGGLEIGRLGLYKKCCILKRGTGVNEKFLVRLNLPKIHPKIFFSE
jgi:hypothetical protein